MNPNVWAACQSYCPVVAHSGHIPGPIVQIEARARARTWLMRWCTNVVPWAASFLMTLQRWLSRQLTVRAGFPPCLPFPAPPWNSCPNHGSSTEERPDSNQGSGRASAAAFNAWVAMMAHQSPGALHRHVKPRDSVISEMLTRAGPTKQPFEMMDAKAQRWAQTWKDGATQQDIIAALRSGTSNALLTELPAISVS